MSAAQKSKEIESTVNNEDSNAQANENESKSTSAVQSTLQVQFTTKIAEQSMRCDETIYALTSTLKPVELSKVVNHILNKTQAEDLVDFDFLIDNQYILPSKSLAEHLSENDISSEQTLIVEYIEKTIEPSAKSSHQHPDWVSCVDALKLDLFITGCYDGIIRVWKPNEELFCQYRGHIAPIKGISALYTTKSSTSNGNVYYFSTVAKDRSVKVFGLTESSKQIQQICKIDTKSQKQSHRYTVDCVSAPYPSKVFATGSADREIKIYRMQHKHEKVDADLADDDEDKKSEPPSKKRKLNDMEASVEASMDQEAEDEADEDDDMQDESETAVLSNVSTLRGHSDAVKCLDWAHPSALYSGSWDNCIKLWDVHKEIDSYTWSTRSGVSCLKFWNAQKVLISAHTNQKIAIWDPRTDRNISSKTMSEMTFRSHRLPITGIDVDGMAGMEETNKGKLRNSDYLFITSSHDGKLKIWDIRCQTPLYNVEKHEGKVLCVGWYGNTIVSGGADCKLRSFKW
eukprot:CAMPEP_0197031640 /NCGR_PEP_ID=MMETSP1384-20130603/10590_1 /TAXON_ID=29189 /ORGANISM="Ammonia sp." /LENGTH=513 /DNA_ID=CAMNT_0042461199 /DNA_START=42 /DNA_END=1580 /DNA_ORIENTATION=-